MSGQKDLLHSSRSPKASSFRSSSSRSFRHALLPEDTTPIPGCLISGQNLGKRAMDLRMCFLHENGLAPHYEGSSLLSSDVCCSLPHGVDLRSLARILLRTFFPSQDGEEEEGGLRRRQAAGQSRAEDREKTVQHAEGHRGKPREGRRGGTQSPLSGVCFHCRKKKDECSGYKTTALPSSASPARQASPHYSLGAMGGSRAEATEEEENSPCCGEERSTGRRKEHGKLREQRKKEKDREEEEELRVSDAESHSRSSLRPFSSAVGEDEAILPLLGRHEKESESSRSRNQIDFFWSRFFCEVWSFEQDLLGSGKRIGTLLSAHGKLREQKGERTGAPEAKQPDDKAAACTRRRDSEESGKEEVSVSGRRRNGADAGRREKDDGEDGGDSRERRKREEGQVERKVDHPVGTKKNSEHPEGRRRVERKTLKELPRRDEREAEKEQEKEERETFLNAFSSSLCFIRDGGRNFLDRSELYIGELHEESKKFSLMLLERQMQRIRLIFESEPHRKNVLSRHLCLIEKQLVIHADEQFQKGEDNERS